MDQEIVYEKLPTDIAERFVLLMDPILGTGGSASRAVNVLLDKGVEEGKILFLRCGLPRHWLAGPVQCGHTFVVWIGLSVCGP
jgi:hypoxanthine-guanine phosphoribosyltransferase